MNEPIWSKEEFEEIQSSPEFREGALEKVLDKKFRKLLNPFGFGHGRKKFIVSLLKKVMKSWRQEKTVNTCFQQFQKECKGLTRNSLKI